MPIGFENFRGCSACLKLLSWSHLRNSNLVIVTSGIIMQLQYLFSALHPSIVSGGLELVGTRPEHRVRCFGNGTVEQENEE